jgi:hypothetical protein
MEYEVNKKWKSKIKEKIEELNKEESSIYNGEYIGDKELFRLCVISKIKEVLEELLEKE